MLAEASQPLAERQYQTLRTLSGIAAVTKRSGKQLSVHMRYACNERLRNAFHYWADAAKDHDDMAKARYAEHRKAGQPHGRALRSVAERLLRVLMAMLKAGTLYDPAHPAKRRLATVASSSVSKSTRRPVPRAVQKPTRKRARVGLAPTPVPPVLAAQEHPLQNGGESSPGTQTRRPLPTGRPAGRGDVAAVMLPR